MFGFNNKLKIRSDVLKKPSENHAWIKCDMCNGSGYFGYRDILGAFGEENQRAANNCWCCGGARGSYQLPHNLQKSQVKLYDPEEDED